MTHSNDAGSTRMSERLRAPRPMRRRPDYGQVSSNHFVKQPLMQGQRTQVELWGRLPLNSDDEGEELGSNWWRSFADSQDEEHEDEGGVHEGTLLEKLSHIAVVSVAVGAGHVIILGEGGHAFAYGRNQRGQLGLGDTSERLQPAALAPLSLGPAEQAPGLDDREADDWSIAGVACGTEHTLFLARSRASSLESWVFASGAADMLGCDACADGLLPRAVPGTLGAAAVAARRRSNCCGCTVGASPRDSSRRSGMPSFETPDEPTPDQPRSCADAPANQEAAMSGRPSLASHPSTPFVSRPTGLFIPAETLAPPPGESVLYFWGEFLCDVDVARASRACDFFDAPEAVFRLPTASRKLALGGRFGLALDVAGAVYAWGDDTYGELGGAAAPSWAPAPEAAPLGPEHHWRSLPVPGKVQLPEGMWLEQPASPAPRAKSRASYVSANSTPAMTPSPDVGGRAPTEGEASSRAVTANSVGRAGTALTPGVAITPATPHSVGRAGTNASLRRALSRGLGRATSFTSTASSARRQRRIPSKGSARSADSHVRLRPPEAAARQPPSPSVSPCPARHPRVEDVACGERHALLLDERGLVFAFGDNVAGQCGVPQAVGASHGGGSTVSRPSQVLLQPPRRSSRHFDAVNERGAGVFAGDRHSGVVTSAHRLYLWGHPSNQKLGDVGFNLDGTEAGEDPSKPRPPGVAVRSGLRDAARRPRLVYSQLHRKVHALGLGEDCTLIVTGDGGGRRGQVAASEESASLVSRQVSTGTPEVEAERSDAALQI